MKLIIACLLFVAVRGQFTNNSTQDRYIQPEDRVYVQPDIELTLYCPCPEGIKICPCREGIKIWPTAESQQRLYPEELWLRRPMKVIVHGYHSTGKSLGRKMATNFLTYRAGINDGNVNIIAVRWRSKRMLYKKAAFRSMDVGEFLFRWLADIVYPTNPNLDLHLIGHSLGAQAVGKTGRLLMEWQSDRTPRRVTGLDPAGPMFEWFKTKNLQRIGKDSGQFVDIIHTNPGVLGVKKPYGHLDFYVDGGFQNLRQFRGFREGKSKWRNKLSHSYANTMFIESILEPMKYESLPCGTGGVDPTVKTKSFPICTYRPDLYRYRNFLGNGAIKRQADEAYGTYIADLEESDVKKLIQYVEGLDMDDGMETAAGVQ